MEEREKEAGAHGESLTPAILQGRHRERKEHRARQGDLGSETHQGRDLLLAKLIPHHSRISKYHPCTRAPSRSPPPDPKSHLSYASTLVSQCPDQAPYQKTPETV